MYARENDDNSGRPLSQTTFYRRFHGDVIRRVTWSTGIPGALSLASPGVPGNCRKQCSVPGKLPGDTMVVLVGQMGILCAHAWCGTSVKNTMEETIMKRII